MKKILVTLAVAGVLATPAAMADTSNVEVYGQMNLSLDLVKSGAPVGSVSANQVNTNESRLGFKGSEKLDNGLSAIFQIESSIAADTGTGSTLAGRNSFGGLKSDSAGALTFGYHDTPYKAATRGLDVFGGGIADNRSLMGQGGVTQQDRRVKNSINYMSPAMSGFSISANYSAGGEDAAASTDTKGKVTSIAAMYDMAPFYATIAQQKETFGTALTGTSAGTVGDSDKAFKVGGSFKMDMFAVNVVIENTNFTAGATSTKARNLYLAGQYNISSNNAVKLAITQAGDMKANGATVLNSGARQLSLGYDHMMSKRTTVYALYTKLSNEAGANYALKGDTSGGPANGGANADPTAISLGMKHSF